MFWNISLPVKEHFIHWDFAFISGKEFFTVDCKGQKELILLQVEMIVIHLKAATALHRQKHTDIQCHLLNKATSSQNHFKPVLNDQLISSIQNKLKNAINKLYPQMHCR